MGGYGEHRSEFAWYRLVWLFKVALIPSVVAGSVHLALEGLPFREWIRVDIVIGREPEG